MGVGSQRMAAAIKAAGEKRTREGTVEIVCPGCGKTFRKQKHLAAKAKTPTCGRACRSKVMTGAGNPRWSGGRWKDRRSGYVYLRTDLLAPEDRVLVTGSPRQVYEHRLVMARVLGRRLRKTEMVHHRNGVKDDNRPSNLTVTDWATHSKEHRAIERRMTELERTNRVLLFLLIHRA